MMSPPFATLRMGHPAVNECQYNDGWGDEWSATWLLSITVGGQSYLVDEFTSNGTCGVNYYACNGNWVHQSGEAPACYETQVPEPVGEIGFTVTSEQWQATPVETCSVDDPDPSGYYTVDMTDYPDVTSPFIYQCPQN